MKKIIIVFLLILLACAGCGVEASINSASITPPSAAVTSPSPSVSKTPEPTQMPLPTPAEASTPAPTQSNFPVAPVVIKFKDKIVEKVIRTMLNQPEGSITDQDMLKVWNFKFNNDSIREFGGEIKTLDDLKWCVNLRSVTLWDTKIKDISALSGTHDLTEFYCQDKIKDFTPLLGNKNLSTIQLTGVTDSFFKKLMENCGKLSVVYFNKSYISSESLRTLARNYKLSILSLTSCGITDISPVADLKGLQYLSFEFNKIKDISSLAGNPGLSSEIDLSANKITDWSPLEDMTLLKVLSVRDNPVTESPALDKLVKSGCMIYRD